MTIDEARDNIGEEVILSHIAPPTKGVIVGTTFDADLVVVEWPYKIGHERPEDLTLV